jgi:hypothetical protein
MNIFQNKALWVGATLALLMAVTRYQHFGAALTLPDASYAVFFVGGLFLGRVHGALAILAVLIFETVLIDFYAINFHGISAYCVTSAYGFMVFAYAALWFVGRWFAPRYESSVKGLASLAVAAVFAGSAAFIIANVSFYLLAGYFDSMNVIEYVSRVSQYYGSYVAVMLMYVGLAVGVQRLVSKAQAAIIASELRA